ncbi:UDP-4-amino-4,6-dideoxy-N-acetyl-beta-L-altrosamine N-acetyltransferase [Paenibacillus sp. MSJ-34]|uniref:UDP-4-amino-4, 6-dideoxy-N-acetyl-beta-L-altrosamine N-acetyltransferase n=1 Tax=Paenibacillus sp. MSJ-34 TaxID=2841529 RepID=UPI001C0F638A|nr:UDP-4-amino-4,6-dideoxy-N-acetyl-beta-L-altrosamine N-acetyltransferase [Paenibacillus sp. MSJ-34]MBU5441002.1 UDP-4-amino-4,6-dideoxy-N-acetyl-beta-L-altrosamine N-acetyltransferase [Paenibacillus sp. MSJ-34]
MLHFIKFKEEHLEQVLTWRTRPEVTQYMFTDIEYNIKKQLQWFQSISNDQTSKYWIAALNGVHIGLVSLNEIDLRNKRCSWGYYIGESSYRMIGGMIAPYIYNYVFDQLGLKKITGMVMEGNINIRKMHEFHGCREVGVYKEHVYKNDRYHDVYLYELLDRDWRVQKERFGAYKGCFEE